MNNLREQILSKKDIDSEQVYIPQWDVTVEVRTLTGRQRAILLQDTVSLKGKIDFQKLYPQLAVMSTYDPQTGELIFMPGDMDALAEKSGAALEIIAQVAIKLSGLNPDELEKNSETTPSEDSILS